MLFLIFSFVLLKVKIVWKSVSVLPVIGIKLHVFSPVSVPGNNL